MLAPLPPQPPRPTKPLLTAWLLLLVDAGARHGYELCRELDEHQIVIDPGVLYRTLRQLECDGALESEWMAPGAGPRRRCYRLTPAGRGALEDGARQITASRDQHDGFLRAHETRRAGCTSDPHARR